MESSVNIEIVVPKQHLNDADVEILKPKLLVNTPPPIVNPSPSPKQLLSVDKMALPELSQFDVQIENVNDLLKKSLTVQQGFGGLTPRLTPIGQIHSLGNNPPPSALLGIGQNQLLSPRPNATLTPINPPQFAAIGAKPPIVLLKKETKEIDENKDD